MISLTATAHNFATGIHPTREAASMFWREDYNGNGRTIYSYGYHFAICRIEGNTAYFTNRYYSSTTARHCAEVRSAVSHFNIVRCYAPTGTANDNFKYWSAEIITALKALAVSTKPEKHLAEIQRIVSEAQRYADAKGVKLPRELAYYKTFKTTAPKVAKIMKEGKKERAEYLERTREARREHAEYLAQRRAEREAREARWREEENKRREEARATFSDRLDKFNNGFNASFNWYELDENVPMRIQDKKGYKVVYTAKGVTIPMNAAKVFAKRVIDGVIAVGEKLEYYTIGHIDSDRVSIGCHTFRADYLREFAEIVLNTEE